MSQKMPPSQVVNVDLTNTPNLKCPGIDNAGCGCEIFVPMAYIKIISAIVSPTGKEIVANVQNWMCDECGMTLNEIMGARKKVN